MNDVLDNPKEPNANRIYFPELDGLRFFAFFLVFIHHQELFSEIPVLSTIRDNGWMGVDLFFTLSAFLFTKLLIAEHLKTKVINFKRFYLRRVFRIFPIYFLFVGFSIAFFLFKNGIVTDFVETRIIGLFTFTDNIMAALYRHKTLPFISHLWTISYEEQFYLFIPGIIYFLVRASRKMKIAFALTILIIFNVIRAVMIVKQIPHPAIYVLPVTHFESIILGIVIGFGGFDFLLKKFNPLILGLAGAMLFTIACLLPKIDNISFWLIGTYSCVGLSTALVLFSVSSSEFLKRFFTQKLFVFLGKRSYGLYVYYLFGNSVATYLIIHYPMLPSNALAAFMYSLTVTITIAVISYKVVETPFLKLKKKYEIIVSRPI